MILSNGHCQQVKWSSPSLAGWVGQLIRASQESDTPLAYWPNTREQSILSMIECIYPNIDQISTWLVYSHQVYLCLYKTTITEKTARILTHDHCRYISAFDYYFPIYHPLLFGPLNPFCEKKNISIGNTIIALHWPIMKHTDPSLMTISFLTPCTNWTLIPRKEILSKSFISNAVGNQYQFSFKLL